MMPNSRISSTKASHARWAGALLLIGASLPPAAEVTFNPRIALTGTYTDNVLYVDESGDPSDFSTNVRVTLPVEKLMRHGSVLFRYDLRASKFNEFSSLDNVENLMRMDYRTQISRVSSISLRARYAHTQDQADPVILDDSLDDPDPFLAIRTKRQNYGLSFGYGRDVARHWEWNVTTGLAGIDHSPIGGLYPQGDPAQIPEAQIPEDKTRYFASTGAERRLSGNNRIGMKYFYSVTDLERSGEDELHRLHLTFKTRISRRVGIRGEVGGYHRTNDELNDESDGFEASLGIDFNEALTVGPVRFGIGIGVVPSYGGSLEGTSSNRSVFASMTGVRVRPVDWTVVARHSERVPDLLGQSERDTDSLSARMEMSVHRLVGISLSARYVEQDSNDPLEPDSSFYQVGAGLVWRPLGHTRVAGR